MSDVFALSDAFVNELVALQPVNATMVGVPGFDDRWDDFSLDGLQQHQALLLRYQDRVQALPPSEDPTQALAAQVMGAYLDEQLDVYRHGDHLLDLNSIASPFQSIRQVFDVMERKSESAWDNIVRRLERIELATGSYQRLLEAARKDGHTVAARQVRACVEQGRVNAGETSSFAQLPAALEESGVATPALRARLDAAVAHAQAAYAKLADYLEKTYLPSAGDEDAVGRERFQRCARRYLGMKLDAEETYRWGWSELHAIEAEMRRLAHIIQPGRTLPEVIEWLHHDAANCAPSPEAFVDMMLKRQLQALDELSGTHFDIPDPIRRITVNLAPPGGPLGAYYIPPTEDLSRAGSVWYSLGDLTLVPLFDQISTAYHEGFPGHHLQCGIQVTLADRLSRLHRLFIWYPGYGEGWALYTERLMLELGYFEKPEYELGMWACQAMRACRVVVDIGCHLKLPIPQDEAFHPGEVWNYDLGVEFMRDRGGVTLERSRSELTRYLGWPAQAICYKVGERVILGLRDELKRKQGSQFTSKAFHSQVVNSGPMGLDLLRQRLLR